MRAMHRAIAIVPAAFLAACSSVPPPAPHAEIVRGELAGIIAMKGSPCGLVREYSLDDRLDYRVLCESGHVYRIRVTPEGHVAATPHAGTASPEP
jgi:hypothetical protein